MTKNIIDGSKFKIPDEVLDAANLIKNHNFKVYLAGGCVRDLLLDKKPKDWDLVTNASIEIIKKQFPNSIEVGAHFGVIKLKPKNSISIDIAMFRKETGYTDLRHPDNVEVGDEITDAERRDFTVNALYLDLQTMQVLDYVNGLKDMNLRLLRTVGNATKRFNEDALRLIRAIRFSAQLGFKIETDTLAAIKKYGKLLKAISRERIRDEIFKLLETTRPILGLEILAKCGLWEEVFGAKKSSLPADFRSIRMNENPTALSWICALSVTGLFGDALTEKDEIISRLTEKLKLTNTEKKTLSYFLEVFDESQASTEGKSKVSPLEWIEFARHEKQTVDFVKRFIRRARGITVEKKDLAILFLDRCNRWATSKDIEKSFVDAAKIMGEGFVKGPKLGAELKKRHWKSFWSVAK